MLVSVGQRGVGLSAVLRENESFRKAILACLSEPQVSWIHRIKEMPKISWHCHFKQNL